MWGLKEHLLLLLHRLYGGWSIVSLWRDLKDRKLPHMQLQSTRNALLLPVSLPSLPVNRQQVSIFQE